MPDGEVAVSVAGEAKEASVGRNAGEGDAVSIGRGVVEAFQGVPEAHVLCVEGYAVQAVAHVLVLLGHFHSPGRAEVQPLPVRREGGEGLKMVFAFGKGAPAYLFAVDVVHHYIGGHVIHFYPVFPMVVERLQGLVHGKSDIVSGRMPVWVHQRADGRICPGVKLLYGCAFYEYGSSMGRPHMENASGRVSVQGGVAVHAVAVRKVVGQDGRLLVTRQVPLVDAHLLPALVAGRDKPEGNVRVDIFLDANGETLVSLPLPVHACQHGHFHLVPGHQLFPQARRNGEQALLSLYGVPLYVEGAFFASGIGEIEGSHVAGNRHKAVVRLHRRQAADGSGRLDVPGTGPEQQGPCQQAVAVLSHISLYSK